MKLLRPVFTRPPSRIVARMPAGNKLDQIVVREFFAEQSPQFDWLHPSQQITHARFMVKLLAAESWTTSWWCWDFGELQRSATTIERGRMVYFGYADSKPLAFTRAAYWWALDGSYRIKEG